MNLLTLCNGLSRPDLSRRGPLAVLRLHLRQAGKRLGQVRGCRLQRGQQGIQGRVLQRQAGREGRHLVVQLVGLIGQRVFLPGQGRAVGGDDAARAQLIGDLRVELRGHPTGATEKLAHGAEVRLEGSLQLYSYCV